MARQEIDLTTPQPNGKMGEPTKSAWEKVNDMTEELYGGLDASAQLSGKNLLINCGPPINQRSFAGGSLAQGSFGYDRWKAGNGGCVIAISSNGIWTLNGPIQQVIENPHDAWGRPLTISVDSPSGPVGVYVGGATGIIPAGAGRQSVTLTASGSGNMLVDISTSTSTTFSKPQVERGNSATSFDYRMPAIDYVMCRRYYQRGNLALRGNGSSAAGAGTWVPSNMRGAAAVSFANTTYAYGCSNIGFNSLSTGAEIFVSATGAFAFATEYIFEAEL